MADHNARPVALVRRPSSRLAEGLVTHLARRPVDHDLALRQWDAYVGALQAAGWSIVEVPVAPDCPDCVFVEDTVVVCSSVAVLTLPGAPTRRAEVADVEKAVEALGLSINRIRPPGTLEGGDVLQIGDRVYVGRGGRTNAAGVAQLRDILQPLGTTVVGVPISKVLHLKSAVTALPDGTVIGYPPLVDDPLMFDRFMPVPEESGAHVVHLGGDRLLMARGAPGSTAQLRELGWDCVTVDIGEFEKLEGCVTCLSVRIGGGMP